MENPPELSAILRDDNFAPVAVRLARRPTDADGRLPRLLIDLSWNSSRLEGNTYSLLDTRRFIEFGEAVEGHNRLEAQMILNHKDAIASCKRRG